MSIKIAYTKHFLSGPLAGMDIKDHIYVDKAVLRFYTERIKSRTKEKPGSDVLTGDKYWTSDVSSVKL